MQKTLAALVIILAVTQSVFGQDAEEKTETQPVLNQSTEKKEEKKDPAADKKTTIQINPLLPFGDIFSGEDERRFIMNLESQFKINGWSNIGVELSFLISHQDIPREPFTLYEDGIPTGQERYEEAYTKKMFQINLRPMYIFRPFNTGIKGFYLSVYPHFGLIRIQGNKKEELYGETGLGMDIGYKWVFSNGFTLQLGGGIGKTYGIPKRPSDYSSLNSDGRVSVGNTTDLRLLDFKLGYSW